MERMNNLTKEHSELSNIQEIEIATQSGLAQRRQERKYFDSADWMMGYQPLPNQTYRGFPIKDASNVLAQKKLQKSRKYFDSADWALSGCVPSVLPKVSVANRATVSPI
eukprot:TRINITY_DN312_c0_g1_i1.p1 TRINITY_DN312_c0_g1~~TRINITY_DN312_c0_g1_i1.p1  ORF type:complete len:109 (-),score=26.18 TRINITY_DN312_c0_g1_i1:144-470(-)